MSQVHVLAQLKKYGLNPNEWFVSQIQATGAKISNRFDQGFQIHAGLNKLGQLTRLEIISI